MSTINLIKPKMVQEMTVAENAIPSRHQCCYTNETSQFQVLRISNIPQWFFERVVIPGQRVVFWAPPMARLEVYTGNPVSALLSELIACDRLVASP